MSGDADPARIRRGRLRDYKIEGGPIYVRKPAKHSSQKHRYCERCGHAIGKCICKVKP